MKQTELFKEGFHPTSRWLHWRPPQFDKDGWTEWGWRCLQSENLSMGKHTDIGCFTMLEAKYGIEIQDNVQIGSHCTIYSWSTIDNKKGKVVIKEGACIGTHSVVMPGVTIGKGALVGAFSFVNRDIPDNARAMGIPAKVR